jgi:hypothetical protein
MRNLVLVLFLLSVLFLQGGAKFIPETREYDFGEIYEKDGAVKYNFVFTNRGDEPLLLIDVHAG